MKFGFQNEKMFLSWILVVYGVFLLAPKAITLPFYHQTDYDVKVERVEVAWYNKSFFRDIKFTNGWYNRSLRAFNISAHFLQDMVSTEFVVELQMYKFMSNEYRFFPVTISFNLCHEYAQNNFNVRDVLKKSNFHECPLQKGFYYAHNIMAQPETLPPYIPRGRYQGVAKIYYNKVFSLEQHTYCEIKDKPVVWTK